jgi:hypothetical protein
MVKKSANLLSILADLLHAVGKSSSWIDACCRPSCNAAPSQLQASLIHPKLCESRGEALSNRTGEDRFLSDIDSLVSTASSGRERRRSFWRRTKMVSFRVSDEEFERLRQQSQAHGARSVSEYARLTLTTLDAGARGAGGQPRPADALAEQLQAQVQQLSSQMLELWNTLEQARHDRGDSSQSERAASIQRPGVTLVR